MDILNLKTSEKIEYRKAILKAYIVVLDGMVYKNRSLIKDSFVLEHIETPEVLQKLLDTEKQNKANRADKIKAELIENEQVDLKDNQLQISITGNTASGKTNIALLIRDILKDHGFETKISDVDICNEDINYMRQYRSKILSELKNKTGVSIETNQVITKL